MQDCNINSCSFKCKIKYSQFIKNLKIIFVPVYFVFWIIFFGGGGYSTRFNDFCINLVVLYVNYIIYMLIQMQMKLNQLHLHQL